MRTRVPELQVMSSRSTAGARAEGFTLIEMLVVIAIISILAGLSMVGVTKARQYGQEKTVRSDIALIVSTIERFRTAMGDYPPTSLQDIKITGNGLNDGNESLFAFLLSRKRSGPFAPDLVENRWLNADKDELTSKQAKIVKREINWTRGNNQILEYMDLWGTPYVYIHNRDYGTKFKYKTAEGTVFEVQAQKNPTTGTYYAPTTFQLWSIGLDGENQNGGGDDIVSWQ